MHLFRHTKKSFTIILASCSLFLGSSLFYQADNQAAFAKEKTVTIYLTRHGETTANVTNKVQGWSDFPLTKNGTKVASNLGKGLKGIKFTDAYTGNLTRQYRTAKIALNNSNNKKVSIHESSSLREGGYGSFEGDSIATDGDKMAAVYGYQTGDEFMQKAGKDYWNQLQDAYYKLDKENSDNTKLVKTDRAESSADVQKRMTKEIKHIGKTHANKGGNVLVVSSGMSINQYLSGVTDKYKGTPLKNAAVTKITYKNGKVNVNSIGSLHYVNKGAKVNN
ncbi:phosphoglycerate mutase [Paucilactobacillus hokkaidonensis JCM 18461]|uniref:Phosphoglycerate mutase n=2 Tax=Paucilactobacillus hokkaidonensis TaxID=1193095 RepID=A0A0A1GS08_9LACO|nr:histidine phosphatase family protein [Paucilactobacillus hokkaidonensis]BAP84775.1 phosphoglycerate mutase [Paucilactobacillus hokkaidonensis JCM 18461]